MDTTAGKAKVYAATEDSPSKPHAKLTPGKAYRRIVELDTEEQSKNRFETRKDPLATTALGALTMKPPPTDTSTPNDTPPTLRKKTAKGRWHVAQDLTVFTTHMEDMGHQRRFKNRVLGVTEKFEIKQLIDPKLGVDEYGIPLTGWKKRVILHPRSSFRKGWDAASLIFITSNAILIPFWLSFEIDTRGFWDMVNYTMDAFFISDIILTFFTAYDDDGCVVFTPRSIAHNYIHSWFFVDVVATFPYEPVFKTLFSTGSVILSLPSLLKVLRLARLLRLMRLLRMSKVFDALQEASTGIKITFRMIRLAIVVLTTSHICGCLWFLVATLEQGEDGFHPLSWVTLYNIEQAPTTTKYLSSIYWATATLTSVGYGDIAANTDGERAMAMLMMLIGSATLALVIGKIGVLAAAMHKRDNSAAAMLDDVNEMMQVRGFPRHLRSRVRRYVHFTMDHKTTGTLSEGEILATLSPALQRACVLSMFRNDVEKVPFLRGADSGFILHFTQKLSSVFCLDDEMVIQQGEVGGNMYIVKSGGVVVYKDNANNSKLFFGDGSFFGEIACIYNMRRTASVKTVDPVELLSLSRHDLLQLMEDFDDFAEGLRAVAEARIRHKTLDDVPGESSAGAGTEEEEEEEAAVGLFKDAHRNKEFLRRSEALLHEQSGGGATDADLRALFIDEMLPMLLKAHGGYCTALVGGHCMSSGGTQLTVPQGSDLLTAKTVKYLHMRGGVIPAGAPAAGTPEPGVAQKSDARFVRILPKSWLLSHPEARVMCPCNFYLTCNECFLDLKSSFERSLEPHEFRTLLEQEFCTSFCPEHGEQTGDAHRQSILLAEAKSSNASGVKKRAHQALAAAASVTDDDHTSTSERRRRKSSGLGGGGGGKPRRRSKEKGGHSKGHEHGHGHGHGHSHAHPHSHSSKKGGVGEGDERRGSVAVMEAMEAAKLALKGGGGDGGGGSVEEKEGAVVAEASKATGSDGDGFEQQQLEKKLASGGGGSLSVRVGSSGNIVGMADGGGGGGGVDRTSSLKLGSSRQIMSVKTLDTTAGGKPHGSSLQDLLGVGDARYGGEGGMTGPPVSVGGVSGGMEGGGGHYGMPKRSQGRAGGRESRANHAASVLRTMSSSGGHHPNHSHGHRPISHHRRPRNSASNPAMAAKAMRLAAQFEENGSGGDGISVGGGGGDGCGHSSGGGGNGEGSNRNLVNAVDASTMVTGVAQALEPRLAAVEVGVGKMHERLDGFESKLDRVVEMLGDLVARQNEEGEDGGSTMGGDEDDDVSVVSGVSAEIGGAGGRRWRRGVDDEGSGRSGEENSGVGGEDEGSLVSDSGPINSSSSVDVLELPVSSPPSPKRPQAVDEDGILQFLGTLPQSPKVGNFHPGQSSAGTE